MPRIAAATSVIAVVLLAACGNVPTVPDPGPDGNVRLSAGSAATAHLAATTAAPRTIGGGTP